MAKTKTGKPKAASMNPADADRGGVFAGGITLIKSVRFGLGYPEGKSENIITLRVAHRPKANSPDDPIRTEYLSCGGKAIDNFRVSKDGKYLIPKSGKASIHENSNAMIFLDSLTKNGFPAKKLSSGMMDVIDGTTIDARQKPIKREGLEIEGDQPERPKTVFVCKKVVKLSKAAGGGTPDAEEETEEEDDADESEDEDESESEDESEDESEEEEGEEEEDSDDDSESEDEDESEEESEDEDAGVDDKIVIKHLKAVVTKAGGSINKSKLGAKAFAALKSEKDRNAICSRMVEDAFLKKQKGWKFDSKKGTITVG